MVKTHTDWTTKEELFLKENYNKITMNQAIQFLRRSKNSIRNRAYQLGVKLLDEWSVIEYAYYDKNGEYVTSGTVYDISEVMGIDVDTLKKYTLPSIQKRLKRSLIKLDD